MKKEKAPTLKDTKVLIMLKSQDAQAVASRPSSFGEYTPFPFC